MQRAILFSQDPYLFRGGDCSQNPEVWLFISSFLLCNIKFEPEAEMEIVS